MIIDQRSNFDKYLTYHKDMPSAYDFLKNFDIDLHGNGRYELSGESFVIVTEYDTIDIGRQFEAHRKYIDGHVIIKGQERNHWSNIMTLKSVVGYDAINECEMFEGNIGADILLGEGSFALYDLQDGHIPGGTVGNEVCHVKKIILKLSC